MSHHIADRIILRVGPKGNYVSVAREFPVRESKPLSAFTDFIPRSQQRNVSKPHESFLISFCLSFCLITQDNVWVFLQTKLCGVCFWNHWKVIVDNCFKHSVIEWREIVLNQVRKIDWNSISTKTFFSVSTKHFSRFYQLIYSLTEKFSPKTENKIPYIFHNSIIDCHEL